MAKRRIRIDNWAKENPEKQRARVARWRAANPEKSKEIDRASHERNKLKRNADSRIYRAENAERMRELGRQWAKDNPDKANALTARRRSAKKNATPAWARSEFEQFAMREAYALATKRSKVTGIVWHVDHIVPLRSTRVCGLHCAANLQVVTASLNHSKGNRVWPDMTT